MEQTRLMRRETLDEEKQELKLNLVRILSKLEKVNLDDIEIINIIPVIKGLKVIYKTSKVKIQKWARTIKYKDLSNM